MYWRLSKPDAIYKLNIVQRCEEDSNKIKTTHSEIKGMVTYLYDSLTTVFRFFYQFVSTSRDLRKQFRKRLSSKVCKKWSTNCFFRSL